MPEKTAEKKKKPFIVFLVLACSLFAVWSIALAVSLDPALRASAVLDGLLFGGLILSALLGLYFFTAVYRGVKKLHRLKSTFIQLDINALKVSVAELAQGNVSIHASASATARNEESRRNGESRISGLLQPLAAIYRGLDERIRESMQEFNLVTDFPCRRLFYVGADSFLEGKKCGELLGKLLGGKGRVAVIMGSLVSSAQSLRKKGFQAALLEKYPDVEIVDTCEDRKSRDKAYEITVDLLKRFPDLAGIYAAQGATPPAIAQAVLDTLNIKSFEEIADGLRVKIVTHDLTADTMSYLARGVISATFSQNPFAQGYDPVVRLYNYILTKENPIIIRHLTLLEEVTAANYREHWDVLHGVLVSEKARAFLAAPLENTDHKPVKIAVILQDDTGFWEPVAAGVRQAAEVLAALGAEVKAVVPEAIRQMDWSAKAFIPVIQGLIDEGFQAISLPLFDRSLIPFINRKAEEGIAIATYNSEPVSLRGMIDAVSRTISSA
jgi:methyl-accepting chemotaxis protein